MFREDDVFENGVFEDDVFAGKKGHSPQAPMDAVVNEMLSSIFSEVLSTFDCYFVSQKSAKLRGSTGGTMWNNSEHLQSCFLITQ